MSFVSDILGGGNSVDTSQMQFKPYNVTTPFGTSTVKKRNITAALSPELQDLYNQYISAAQSYLPTAQQEQFGQDIATAGQGLFGTYLANLNKALGYDVGQSAKDYYQNWLDVQQPEWATEDAQRRDALFGAGRAGIGVGDAVGTYSPEEYAALKAREATKAQMFMTAEDRARAIREAQIQEATGGMGGALTTYGTGTNLPASIFGTSQNILGGAMNIPTSLGQQIGYGLQAGSSAAQAGANIANAQLQEQQNNLGFWGGLLGGVGKGLNYSSGGGWSWGRS